MTGVLTWVLICCIPWWKALMFFSKTVENYISLAICSDPMKWELFENSNKRTSHFITLFLISGFDQLFLYSGKKGNSFVPEPQEIQRDDVGPFGEEASSFLSSGYEISPTWPDWIWSPQNHPHTYWLSCSDFKGLKCRKMHVQIWF